MWHIDGVEELLGDDLDDAALDGGDGGGVFALLELLLGLVGRAEAGGDAEGAAEGAATAALELPRFQTRG